MITRIYIKGEVDIIKPENEIIGISMGGFHFKKGDKMVSFDFNEFAASIDKNGEKQLSSGKVETSLMTIMKN